MKTQPDRKPEPKTGILDIAAYVGGKSKLTGVAEPIKLSSNENALGTSPKAIAAYESMRGQLFRYPDGHANGLRAAVAAFYGLEGSRLIFGNGSDEVFAVLNQAYLEAGDNIITGQHGFLAYRISAQACQADVILVDEPDLRVSVDLLLDAVNDRTKIVYVSNPANPTGTCLTTAEMQRLKDNLRPDVLLVIDEAYAEFVDDPAWESALEMARLSDNVIVTRTFSKIYGLGGMRIGFGYAPLSVIEACERIRMPFNINIAAQETAIAALGDVAFTKASRDLVLQWRPRLTQSLRGMGLTVTASQGNFVLICFDNPDMAAACNEYLMQQGIIVRHVANYGLGQGLRVTIGTDAQNEALLDAIRAFLSL